MRWRYLYRRHRPEPADSLLFSLVITKPFVKASMKRSRTRRVRFEKIFRNILRETAIVKLRRLSMIPNGRHPTPGRSQNQLSRRTWNLVVPIDGHQNHQNTHCQPTSFITGNTTGLQPPSVYEVAAPNSEALRNPLAIISNNLPGRTERSRI